MTNLGIEVFRSYLSDIESNTSAESPFQYSAVAIFLAATVSVSEIMKATFSTTLVETKMKLPRHDFGTVGETEYEDVGPIQPELGDDVGVLLGLDVREILGDEDGIDVGTKQ
jgi:hypothetical protein